MKFAFTLFRLRIVPYFRCLYQSNSQKLSRMSMWCFFPGLPLPTGESFLTTMPNCATSFLHSHFVETRAACVQEKHTAASCCNWCFPPSVGSFHWKATLFTISRHDYPIKYGEHSFVILLIEQPHARCNIVCKHHME